ncbi:hypothetical protein MKW98_018374 [Papaver atlanticum]|uniref:Uncharacterized protein n=1 Tax=Papaver atlanticum TaxID=357466 RepID=A0AAD4T3P6_9MAGN|nr:hypothetical protein MKW98_018374 [Papaver atlanticum]
MAVESFEGSLRKVSIEVMWRLEFKLVKDYLIARYIKLHNNRDAKLPPSARQHLLRLIPPVPRRAVQYSLKQESRGHEGRELGLSAGSTKCIPKIEFYGNDRKKSIERPKERIRSLITAAKTYNPSADVVPETPRAASE